MSQNNTLLNEVWTKSLNAMKQMFLLQSMSTNVFMELYNAVYNYFISSEYNESLINTSLNKPKIINESNKNDNQTDNDQVDRNIPGGEMYFKLKAYLKEQLENIARDGNNLKDEDFLRFYAKTWEKYQFLSQIINKLFSSMNSNWVQRRQTDGVRGIYEVFTTAMQIWQDIFFKEDNRSLTQTCLKLIKDERDGKHINTLLIRQVVQSYVSIGFTEVERQNRNNQRIEPALTIYKEYFEKQFLEETKQFYQLESNNLIENNSTNDYLKKITQRLKEEERRVKDYLHPTTLEKLKPKLEEILIKNQLDLIYIESKKLLRDEKIEDLRILFELVNRIVTANGPIQTDLENYMYESGMNAIELQSATAINDPKIYVETIIEIRTRFDKIVKEAFCSEHGYIIAFDKACSKFINNNAVTTAAGSTKKSAELLARYCDIILKKGNKAEESDVEEKLNQIMAVFNYIEDKDAFLKFHGKLLGKRLIGQLSASDDYEESMISKLKAACGFEYASKLQRMFQDIRLSTNLIDEYKTYCANMQLTNIVDFPVMVLTSNSWSFSAPSPFNLPIELKRTFDSFTNFYSKKFTGRKLEWLYQHSKGELQTLYTGRKYILQLSTYQMAILLLFNEFESMSVERILDATQIEAGLFTQVLLTLLKSKVLICSEINADRLNKDLKESDIKINYTIQVDEDFKSTKVRINLNQPIKSIEQKDTETVNQSIDEDRKMVIQAAIVRTMKTRKDLKHTALIQEVISLLQKFKPQIPMIKKCIDILIEKGYLERDSNERDRFRYLA